MINKVPKQNIQTPDFTKFTRNKTIKIIIETITITITPLSSSFEIISVTLCILIRFNKLFEDPSIKNPITSQQINII